MKVSVVLPVYNANATIHRAIQSIQEQSFTDFELIVVNDGSTDSSVSIINELASQDHRIKVFSLSRSGVAKALNFGIKKSKGDYIARMDADDISPPERLKMQTEYLDKNSDVGLVSSLVRYCGDFESNEGYVTYVNWINKVVSPTDIQIKRFSESPFAHPSVMFRQSLIHQFGGYQEGLLPEDYELWLRWLRHNVKMHKINEYLLDWYDHPARLSRTHKNYEYDLFYMVKAKYVALFLAATFGKKLPELWVWGAGRIVNKRVSFLANHGLGISKFIDVNKRNEEKSRFVHHTDIPSAGKIFILCYVSDRKGKSKIFEYLIEKGYREGVDFFMMA